MTVNVGAISGSFEFQVRNALVGINKSLRELKKLNSGIDDTEKKSKSGGKSVDQFGKKSRGCIQGYQENIDGHQIIKP